jgi:alpha-D-xyloside xylohydrolase
MKRVGAFLAMSPVMQYVDEITDAPYEIRIYRGADGEFTLYEDAGDNYNYEKGAYATISLHWDEKTQILTIGERHGEFPGMLRERTFRVVWVAPGHGSGLAPTEKADVKVRYSGQTTAVRFAQAEQ